MSEFLFVKNWTKFQHYRDRDPPWIKLHKSLLDDYEFCRLQDASKLHLIMLWLYAARNNGRMPNDPEFLRNKLSLSKPPDLKLLIEKGFLIVEQDASVMLSPRLQDAMPEGEGETYKQEAETEVDRRAPRFTIPTVEQVAEYCLERRNAVDAQRFVDHYTANGWKVGRNQMKDWKASVRTWEKNEHSGNGKQPERKSQLERAADALRVANERRTGSGSAAGVVPLAGAETRKLSG